MKTRAPQPGERVVREHQIAAALHAERLRVASGVRRVVYICATLTLLQAIMLIATIFIIHGSRA
jgi:hypothetical protein